MFKAAKLFFIFSLLISNAAFAALETPLWDLTLKNTNACARDSQKPATSFYLYADGLTVGRAIAKLAQNQQQDVLSSVKASWSELHRSLYFISDLTLNALLSNQLPLISSSDEINKDLLNRFLNSPTRAEKQPRCLRIKKAFPTLVDTNKVKAKELELLAKASMDSDQYIDNCSSLELEDAVAPELALRWDLESSSDKISFEFWQSYKIYLTAFWKMEAFKNKAPQYSKWLRSFPIEEMTLLIPEGCKSLTRPECRTDFLSQSQLTNLLAADDFKDGNMLARDFGKQQLDVESQASPMKGITPLNDPADIMKNLRRVRQQSAYLLFQSQTRLTALFNQKSVSQLIQDIQTSLSTDNQDSWNALESACVENQVFSDQKMSALAKELQNNGSLVRTLEQNNFPGAKASESLAKTFELSKALAPFCESHKERLLKGQGAAGSKAWLSDYFSKILPSEVVDKILKPAPLENSTYLKLNDEVLCSSPIACWREAIEASTRLYQVAITSSVTQSSNQTLDSDLGRNHSGAVACKVFDPWAENNRRLKKLLLDTASAIATGLVQIPLYLDLNPSVPRVASFQELLDKDAVRLDPVFWQEGWKKTLFLDFGPLTHTPCMISVSADGPTTRGSDMGYLFKGISTNICASNKSVRTEQDIVGVTSATSNRQAACGVCSINFQSVSTLATRHGFGLVGAGLRMVGALVNFFRSSSDPRLKPKTLTISPAFLVEAYQRYGRIPDQCVYELTRREPCLKNICQNKTVKDFEDKYQIRVEKSQLYHEEDFYGRRTDEKTVIVKTIDGRVSIPITCDGKTNPTIYWNEIEWPKKKTKKVSL